MYRVLGQEVSQAEEFCLDIHIPAEVLDLFKTAPKGNPRGDQDTSSLGAEA